MKLQITGHLHPPAGEPVPVALTVEVDRAALLALLAGPEPAEPEPDRPTGLIRAEAEAEPPAPFTRSAPRPQRAIQAEDVDESWSTEKKLMALVAGFRDSSECSFIATWAAGVYKEATGKKLAAGEVEVETEAGEPLPVAVDQVELDLAELRKLDRGELEKRDGTVNASEVARRLGYLTGGSDWERVRELAAMLQAEWDEMDQEELIAEVA